MFPRNDTISRRQLVAMGVMCMLSPLIRRIPGRVVAIAGAGAWLSVLLAAAPLILLVLLALHMSRRGRDLGSLFLEIYGPLGRLLLLLYSAWFTFMAAFTLRSDADRFITTVYPNSSPAIFVLTMLAALLPALWGPLKALARSAMLLRPVMVGILLLVFAFSLGDVDMEGLWQPAEGSDLPILLGALDVLNPLSVCLYLGFLADRVKEPLRFSQTAAWLGAVLAIAAGMVIVTVGLLGVELTARIRNPFFAVLRDLTLFGTVEHVEAVLVSAWVFSDFIYLATLGKLAARCLCLALSIPSPEEAPAKRRLSQGRFAVPLFAALAGTAALCIAPRSSDLLPLSNTVVPLINLSMTLGLLPLTALLGRLRQKL